jgi:hypothetical protein
MNSYSEECEAGDHDDCNYGWCKCRHHSAVAFALEHPGLKSCREVASEQEEMEYV